MSPRARELVLVEDNLGDAELVRRALAKWSSDHNLEVFDRGEPALAHVEERVAAGAPPDLIFLDLNLPTLSGVEVLERLKSNDEIRATPVVIFSSSTAPHEILRCYTAGANSYVTKPIGLADYTDTLLRVVDYWTEVATPPHP